MRVLSFQVQKSHNASQQLREYVETRGTKEQEDVDSLNERTETSKLVTRFIHDKQVNIMTITISARTVIGFFIFRFFYSSWRVKETLTEQLDGITLCIA